MGVPLGPYVIVRLLPVEHGEPHYRVRSSVDGHERALLESQIQGTGGETGEDRGSTGKPSGAAQVRVGAGANSCNRSE